MKLKFEVIPATDLLDGDIFYCTPDFDLNEFGPEYLITGTDQIFIRDDFNEEDDEGNYSILVNGGWTIWFVPDATVVRLAHYRDLLRIIDMVKLGNPEMPIGANDSTTILSEYFETFPEQQRSPLDDLDINPEDFKDKSKNKDEDEMPF